jgi:hypothetical protein
MHRCGCTGIGCCAERSRPCNGGTAVVAIEPGGELVPIMGANPMRGGRVDEVEAGAAERTALVLADYLKGDAPAPFERVPGG